MSNCSDYREDLSAYIDGELSWDERDAIEKHIAACPACAYEYSSLKRTQEFCQQLTDIEAPSDLTSRIMTGVREQHQHQMRQRRRRYFPAVAVAAALMVFFVGLNLSQLVPMGWRQLSQALPGIHSSDEGFGRGGADGVDYDYTKAPAPEPSAPPGLGVMDVPRDASRSGEDAAMAEAGLLAEDGRLVVKNGEMTLEIGDGKLDEMETMVVDLVEQLDGYVQRSSLWSEPSGRRWTTLTVRVPASEFNQVLYGFDDVAKVINRTSGADDVSEVYMDLSARVRNREAQESRLLEIMDKAENVGEIMQVENELARVRSEIEYLAGRMKYYEQVAALSTIHITLRESGSPIVEIANWWDDVREAFLNSLRGLGVYIALVLPYLALIAALWFGLKRMRRGGENKN